MSQTRPESAVDATQRSSATFSSSFDVLRRVRAWIRERLATVSWLGPDRTNDVVMATSEIVTNAVEHGAGTEFDTTIEANEREVAITVESGGELFGATTSPTELDARTPQPEQPAGRGLLIARRLSDSLSAAVRHGRTRITARFRR